MTETVVLCAAALAEPSLRGIFMPPLLAKWAALSDTDAELLPLMECLMTIATALGGAALWESVDQYSSSITIILVMADHSAGTADASPCHLLRVCMCLVVHPRLLGWLCNRVGECGLLMTRWLLQHCRPSVRGVCRAAVPALHAHPQRPAGVASDGSQGSASGPLP